MAQPADTKARQRPWIVALAGGTCAGKTTVTTAIIDAVGAQNISMLNQDSYYRDQTHIPIPGRYDINYDHPDALDMDLMIKHIGELRGGKDVQVPKFDYVPCARLPETETVSPRPLILVDGILLLHDPSLRQLFDLILFIDADADLRLVRRIQRDVQRGMKVEDVLSMYERHVRPMHAEFVEPFKLYAHVIIPNVKDTSPALAMISGYLKGIVGGDK